MPKYVSGQTKADKDLRLWPVHGREGEREVQNLSQDGVKSTSH